MNIFWETIAQYNAGTWIYQLIITLVGLWLTYSLFHHPTPAKKKGMKLYLIFINAWVAVVYYHIYCDPRSYSNALALFWGNNVLLLDLRFNSRLHSLRVESQT